MAFCTSHPEVETARVCSRCQRPFCDRCLVDLVNQPHCAGCKRVALEAMHTGRQMVADNRAPDGATRGFVRWARIYDALGALVCLVPTALLIWDLAPSPYTVISMIKFGGAYVVIDKRVSALALLAMVVALFAHLVAAITLRPGRKWTYYLQWAVAVMGLPAGVGVLPILYLIRSEIRAGFGVAAA